MKAQFKIKLTQNFELVCLLLSANPATILQSYINGISIPKLLSTHPDDPLGENIDLLLSFTKSQDPPSVEKKIIKFLETSYKNELASLINLEIEQPELESKLRVLVNSCCLKVTELRQSLRTPRLTFKINSHDY